MSPTTDSRDSSPSSIHTYLTNSEARECLGRLENKGESPGTLNMNFSDAEIRYV